MSARVVLLLAALLALAALLRNPHGTAPVVPLHGVEQW